MRHTFLIALMALMVSACASKREIASTQDVSSFQTEQQAQRYDAGASSRGSSIR